MVKLPFVQTFPNHLPWQAHALHYLQGFFIHMHSCKVLSNRHIIMVGELNLLSIVRVQEQIVDIYMIQKFLVIASKVSVKVAQGILVDGIQISSI